MVHWWYETGDGDFARLVIDTDGVVYIEYWQGGIIRREKLDTGKGGFLKLGLGTQVVDLRKNYYARRYKLKHK
jgi:hypothetical protein